MSEVEYQEYNPYQAPPAAQTQPKIGNEQFIQNAYNSYLGRQATPQEISRQISEGTSRGESQDQWLKRVTAGMQRMPGRPPPSYQPTTIDPTAARAAYTKSQANPYYGGGGDREAYGDPNAGMDWANYQKQISENVRALPGARPDIGYIPGLGAIDLLSFTPFQWQDNSRRRGGGLTQVEQRLSDFFSGRPDISMPRWQDVRGDFTPSGRGYNYAGQASEREQQLVNSGQITPQTVKEYSALVNPRIRQNKMSSMQRFANDYYGPALMATVGAIGTGGVGAALGPGWGAAAGAGFGALSQGAQTRWKDPAAVGIGALGGAAGGYAGGAGGAALGLGDIGSGALAGAGSSLGRDVSSSAYRGDWNPSQILRNAGIGAVVGGGMGGLRGFTKPGYTNTPSEPGGGFSTPPSIPPGVMQYAGPGVAGATGKTLDYYLPGRQDPQNPYRQRRKRPGR